MPSPLGHAIAGAAAGWLVTGPPSSVPQRDRVAREALLFGGLAMLPDIDLVVGGHRGPTHSIGAAIIVGAIAAVASWSWSGNRARPHAPSMRQAMLFGLACMAAYGSHIPLDWASHDNTPPIGIMALWPFTHDYYASPVQVFLAISRRYYQGWRFVIQNTLAVARELVVLVPILILVMMTKPRGRPDGRPDCTRVML